MRAPQRFFGSLAAIALLLYAAPVYSAPAVGAGERVEGTCAITFHGTSTLHGFSGTAPPQAFTLATSTDAKAGSARWSTEIRLPVRSLDTGIGARNRNMMKMFEADKHPYVVATFARIDPAAADQGRARSTPKLPFTLKIRDAARKTLATITDWKADGHEVSFDADFSVSLKAFGLTAPSALGFIHVHDKVDVHAHVVINEAPPGPQ